MVVFLRGLGAGEWDLGTLPAKRVAALARWAQTASNQALAQSAAERRYPALLAFGAERLAGVADELVDLSGKLLADTNAKARPRLGEYQKSVAGAANDKVLLAQIARLLLDPGLPDEERLGALFDAVPKDRLAAALADCERIARPASNSHVDLLGDQRAWRSMHHSRRPGRSASRGAHRQPSAHVNLRAKMTSEAPAVSVSVETISGRMPALVRDEHVENMQAVALCAGHQRLGEDRVRAGHPGIQGGSALAAEVARVADGVDGGNRDDEPPPVG